MTLPVKNLLVWIVLPAGLGFLSVVPIINSQNGYVAGFIFLPLFLLVVLASLCLFIAGLIATGIKGGPGLWVLLSSFMLFGGFMGTVLLAKQFEIGSYHEDPMIHYPPPIANKVLFKQGATNEEIERFWSQVVGYPTGETDHWSRPGVGTVMRAQSENGHEVVIFSFQDQSTDEEKASIRARICSYPPVFQYLENVSTKVESLPEPSPEGAFKTKRTIVVDSANANQ